MYTDFVKGKNTATFKKLIKASIFGNIVTLLVLMSCSMLLWRGDIPESISSDLALGAAFAGGITAGIIAARGEHGSVLSGLLGGSAYLVVVAIVGLYRSQTDFFDLNFIKLLICSLAGGVFGGVISTGKKPKKRIKRPKKYTNSNR